MVRPLSGLVQYAVRLCATVRIPTQESITITPTPTTPASTTSLNATDAATASASLTPTSPASAQATTDAATTNTTIGWQDTVFHVT